MTHAFLWNGRLIPFVEGQTVASALALSCVRDFGSYSPSTSARYFCGIGACQSCLVTDRGGAPFESCITRADEAMCLRPFLTDAGDNDV